MERRSLGHGDTQWTVHRCNGRGVAPRSMSGGVSFCCEERPTKSSFHRRVVVGQGRGIMEMESGSPAREILMK